MPPRALAVTLPTALAAWLALFLTGCSDSAPDTASAASAGESVSAGKRVGFRYVTHRVIQGNDFKRISEYFSGEENKGGDIVLRTDSKTRAGLYFLLTLAPFDELPEGAVAVVEFVAGDKPEPRRHLFVLPPIAASDVFKEVRLGVTGADWPAPAPSVIAWKITLRDTKTGALLAADQSFLWALPPKGAAGSNRP